MLLGLALRDYQASEPGTIRFSSSWNPSITLWSNCPILPIVDDDILEGLGIVEIAVAFVVEHVLDVDTVVTDDVVLEVLWFVEVVLIFELDIVFDDDVLLVGIEGVAGTEGVVIVAMTPEQAGDALEGELEHWET